MAFTNAAWVVSRSILQWQMFVGTAMMVSALLLATSAAQGANREHEEADVQVVEEDYPQLIPTATAPHLRLEDGSRPVDDPPAETGGDAATAPIHFPAIHHPWARYPVGAWREIEITTETFDEEGNLFGKSVTTQVEILKSVGETSYQLDVQASVDISGKQINGDWNTRSLRLVNDRSGQIMHSEELPESTLQIGAQEVSCQVMEITTSEETRNRTERIYYSPENFPHVLRREVLDTDSESADEWQVRDQMQVTALAVPYYLGNRIVKCSSTHTTRRQEKGTTVRVRFVSEEVPGGEVASWSSDFNASGKRVRWSVARLVEHGMTDASGPESRRRMRFGQRLGRNR